MHTCTALDMRVYVHVHSAPTTYTLLFVRLRAHSPTIIAVECAYLLTFYVAGPRKGGSGSKGASGRKSDRSSKRKSAALRKAAVAQATMAAAVCEMDEELARLRQSDTLRWEHKLEDVEAEKLRIEVYKQKRRERYARRRAHALGQLTK